ncbi:MAG: heat-inducible transcription repressor HrcA [Candidatus Schekmanbacteria bacterium]|nr:heat-inducible transcription repressor HrcA [Candidatus Schekmanbacteria bacterium]
MDAIVHSFVTGIQPVGSRTISRRYNLGLSPATIRNVMSDLEDEGYIMQPHTSAGRVPTDKGYRYFVDRLMGARNVSQLDARLIHNGISSESDCFDDLMARTTELLSEITQHASLILAPALRGTPLKHVEFIQIRGPKILALFVGAAGMVREQLVVLPESISQDDLSRVSRFVNERFEGKTLHEIRDELLLMLSEERVQYDDLFRKAVSISAQAFADAEPGTQNGDRIYIGGQNRLFDQPEFADAAKIRQLFQALEDKQRLVEILSQCLSQQSDVTVVIGSENPEAFADVSIVSGTYKRQDKELGTISVIGPTRMDYSKIVSLVSYVAKLITELLSSPERES